MIPHPLISTLFPYTTLFRSAVQHDDGQLARAYLAPDMPDHVAVFGLRGRSEEHTSELQSLTNLVCRLLLEKKKTAKHAARDTHRSMLGDQLYIPPTRHPPIL